MSMTVFVVEYVPKENAKFSSMTVAFNEFTKQIKGPLRLLSSVSGVTFTAQQLFLNSIPSYELTKHPHSFEKGEHGLKVLLNPVILNNDQIEFQIDCHFRSNLAQTDGKSVNANLTTSMRMRAGYPIVIYTRTIPNAANTKANKPLHKIAIIVSAQIVNSVGLKTDVKGRPIL